MSNIPWSEVEDIEESGQRITSNFTNFSLLHESIVEEIGGVLLFFVILGILSVARSVLSLQCLLLCGRPWDVKSHLDQLVLSSTSLLATSPRPAQSSIGARIISIHRQGEFDGDLVLARKIGIRYLGVGDLEGRTVLHVERQFSLAKLSFAPVPASQRMFFVFQIGAVPILKDLADALEILAKSREQ